VSETPHFVVCRDQSLSRTYLFHTFQQMNVDADLICYVEQELSSLDIVSSERQFGAALFAVMASTFPEPRHQPAIWQRFCLNTLIRLREETETPSLSVPTVSYIAPFGAIYRRIFELSPGPKHLDVGCSFGFLPVLLAERSGTSDVIACDNNPDAVMFSKNLASAVQTHHTTFQLRDVLSADFPALGYFDTVTAIHLLEHLSEQELPIALMHLLQVTVRRLLIAVPYEETIQPLYGHRQTFTRDKLDHWGKWCIEQSGNHGHHWCEDVMGGLLVVERDAVES
ncbi:MAG: class I SAM-dependent methyltransferase, partial [Ktedonobacteraceae bacterium]